MTFFNVYSQETRDAHNGATISTSSPEIDNLVNEIYSAAAGFGTDEDRLSHALGNRTTRERYLISVRYPQIHKKSLLDEVKSETSGDYGKALELLAQPLEDAEATILRDATKGSGTNEDLMYPLLGGRSPEELAILKKAFFQKYQEDLVVVVADDVGGDLKKVYLAALNSFAQTYDPAVHTRHKAEEIAEVIYKAGEGKWGTDESAFVNALYSIPSEFLAAVDAAYKAKHNHGLIVAIEKEFSGDAERALKFHVQIQLNTVEAIADQFEKTMKGLGTDEYGLTAALIRYSSILPQVAQVYKAKHGKHLRERIHGETSGDFQKLLMIVYDRAMRH
ncbi:hypothetical protein H310_09546 [Aphanomyces invadans]|uniref:Annexin n=1 Tax=Aphanomyces invadans TaxID=157072 RepID=A0A024TU06_9STRA|nr:hypothetical protein H310_09546 [Aphanomyces invadans]ETV97655.1 hypothetical protein H310_09546 [Aphanomyces invadans]|eukprot:XP_008873864.1 hypothetical protein H310_09546 [Aphanomyces invadans]